MFFACTKRAVLAHRRDLLIDAALLAAYVAGWFPLPALAVVMSALLVLRPPWRH